MKIANQELNQFVYYNGEPVAHVDYFTYPGTTLQNNISFIKAVKKTMFEQGGKALMSLRNLLKKKSYLIISTIISLFNKLITQIV